MHGWGAGTPRRLVTLRDWPYWAPLALAFALALLPLPLHTLLSNSSTPTEGAEGGMGAPVLIMVEGGARLPAPAVGVLLLLPHALVTTRRIQVRLPWRSQRPPSTLARRARLVTLGRLTLEGG